jgi:arylformamidase
MPESRRIIHDATRPVFAGMPVWPGDSPCDVRWSCRRAEGAQTNNTALSMSVHTGTHTDGPLHVIDGAPTIAAAPLEAYVGPAHLLDAAGRDEIDPDWLHRHLPPGAERVLFRTGCWRDPHVFPTRFAAPTAEAARLLVDRGVRLVGTDAPSIDPFDSEDLPAHQALLGAGVAVVENLLLDGITPGGYELIALPLRLAEADSSPVRAILLETP